MHPYVHCSTIHNSQDMEKPKCPLTDKWIKKMSYTSSHCGAEETNLTSINEDVGLIPGLPQWVGDPALKWAVVWVTDALGSHIAMAVVRQQL